MKIELRIIQKLQNNLLEPKIMKEEDTHKYYSPEWDQYFTAEELAKADSEIQNDVMQHWFFQKFEDPAERTPYESREGGYIYIYGGPYDAAEELEEMFGDIVPEDVIELLVGELESQCYEWTSASSEDDYDDYYAELVLSNTQYFLTFKESIDKSTKLLGVKVEKTLEQNLLRLIYVNIITSLETYLSDAFINILSLDKIFFRKFVETNTDFGKQKFTLNELYSTLDSIEKEVEKYLLSQLWHNLGKVKPLYENTFNISFPENLNKISSSIVKRHDFVHRNGKGKDGKEIIISVDEIEELISHATELVDFIDKQLNGLVEKHTEVEF